MKRAHKVICAVVAAMVLLLLTWPSWIFIFLDGSKLPMPYPGEPEGKILIVEAQELLNEFAKDEAVAREKYGKGRVWVKGKVTEISGPTVRLEANPGVVCVYMSVLEQASLKIGRETMIEGRLKGSKDQLTLFRPWTRMTGN